MGGYCERLGPEFWAEPINAVTNAAFIVAAVLSLMMALRAKRLDGPVMWLTGLVFCIGVGSFLFHTFSNRWSLAADVIPIQLFILTYFTVVMNRFLGHSWKWSAVLTVGWLASLILMALVLRPTLMPFIGGTVGYVPAFIGLVAVGGWLWRVGHPGAIWLMFAATVFAASMTFRALDIPVCEDFHVGTHFLWHILNAVVLGVLTVAVIRHGKAPA